MRKPGIAPIALGVALMLAGCSIDSQVGTGVQATATMSSSLQQSSGCPSLAITPGHGVAVDYVDFIHAYGTFYVIPESLGLPPQVVTAADIGDVQLVVGCALSPLNDQAGAAPPTPRDGDAAFVPAGTPVHAVKGWPKSCRLAAQHDGGWHIYLATDPHSTTARALTCATTPTPPATSTSTATSS